MLLALLMSLILSVENVRRIYVDCPPASLGDVPALALPGDVIVCKDTAQEWTVKSDRTLGDGAGSSGDRGLQGETGPAGEAGSQGTTGEQGPKGDKGDKGDPGDTGPEGPQGIQGEQGAAGADGSDGADGAPGVDGDVSACWPIGSVFTSVVATDPATLLGFGTWAALGAGRVLVGFDASQTEFDTLKETGGAKTHTLTVQEMPQHSHTQDAHTHQFLPRSGTSGSVSSIVTGTLDTSSTISGANQPHIQSATATNQNTGGGSAHNNLQPYLVVRFWERTA